ncbi:STAS domain-containing protein, partial [Glomus cerebriforme]
TNPPDGVLIFRFIESLTYPNSGYLDSQIVEYARKNSRKCYKQATSKGDRPWNEIAQEKENEEKAKAELPRLHAVVFDFAAVSIIDSTGVQALVDIRKELNKYADQHVEFHFANIINENIEESLLVAGFGSLSGGDLDSGHGDTENNARSINDEESIKEGTEEIICSPKKFFHLTLDEAVAAATNTSF